MAIERVRLDRLEAVGDATDRDDQRRQSKQYRGRAWSVQEEDDAPVQDRMPHISPPVAARPLPRFPLGGGERAQVLLRSLSPEEKVSQLLMVHGPCDDVGAVLVQEPIEVKGKVPVLVVTDVFYQTLWRVDGDLVERVGRAMGRYQRKQGVGAQIVPVDEERGVRFIKGLEAGGCIGIPKQEKAPASLLESLANVDRGDVAAFRKMVRVGAQPILLPHLFFPVEKGEVEGVIKEVCGRASERAIDERVLRILNAKEWLRRDFGEGEELEEVLGEVYEKVIPVQIGQDESVALLEIGVLGPFSEALGEKLDVERFCITGDELIHPEAFNGLLARLMLHKTVVVAIYHSEGPRIQELINRLRIGGKRLVPIPFAATSLFDQPLFESIPIAQRAVARALVR